MLAGRIAHWINVRAGDVAYGVVSPHAFDGAARSLDNHQRVIRIEFLDDLESAFQRRQRLLAPLGFVLSLVGAQSGMFPERRQQPAQQRFTLCVAGLELGGLAQVKPAMQPVPRRRLFVLPLQLKPRFAPRLLRAGPHKSRPGISQLSERVLAVGRLTTRRRPRGKADDKYLLAVDL